MPVEQWYKWYLYSIYTPRQTNLYLSYSHSPAPHCPLCLWKSFIFFKSHPLTIFFPSSASFIDPSEKKFDDSLHDSPSHKYWKHEVVLRHICMQSSTGSNFPFSFSISSPFLLCFLTPRYIISSDRLSQSGRCEENFGTMWFESSSKRRGA